MRLAAFAGCVFALLISTGAVAQETIKLGLVAALSGQSAKSGEAITRGLSLAIDEINAKGGIMGKKLVLVSRDDESNPAKGVLAARELVQREHVAAFSAAWIRRSRSPSCRSPIRRRCRSWGFGQRAPTSRANGAKDNYVFRVSAVDDLVDVALVDYAVKKYAAKKPGMILINNAWGESNEAGLKTALAAKKLPMRESKNSKPKISTSRRSSTG
jgi:branched-chain amino acid transport system substrate-binding protein